MSSGSSSKTIDKVEWHKTYPLREFKGKVTASYNDLSLTVKCTGTLYWSSGYAADLTDTLSIYVDNSKWDSASHEYPETNENNKFSSGDVDLTCNATKTVSAGNHTVGVYIKCSDTDCRF